MFDWLNQAVCWVANEGKSWADRSPWQALLVVQVLVLASYVPAFFYSGFVMDDAVAIEKNPVVVGTELRLEELMSRDFWGLPMHGTGWTNKSFRPLTTLTYRWNYLLHGLASSGFHITNVLLHCLTSIIVGRTATIALGMPGAWAAAAAVLFGAHPVHTENILYLVGRADVLAALLGLAALNAYLALFCPAPLLNASCDTGTPTSARNRAGLPWDLLGLLPPSMLIVASGLCKETGFTFFAILLGVEFLDVLTAYDRAVASRQHAPARVWRRVRVRLGLLVATTLMVFVMRYRHTGGTELNMSPQDNPISFESSRLVRMLSYAYIHGVYARLLCWPQFLCYDYSMDAIPPVQTVLDSRLLLTLATYVGFAAAVTATLSAPRRYRRAGLISLAVLVVPFLPASNILFPVGTVVGERLLYIPSAGFCLAIIVGLHGIVPRGAVAGMNEAGGGPQAAKTKRQKHPPRQAESAELLRSAGKVTCRSNAGPAFALLAILGLAMRTLVRVRDWESSDTLFLHDGRAQPMSSKTQFNLGITHMQRQEWDEAVQALVRCAWADPLSSLPFYRIGQIEILRGRFASAESFLSAAIDKFGASLMVRDEEVFHDLSVAMFQNGKPEQAERRLRIALRINPDFAKGWNNLACCIASHDLQSAARAARKAASLAPENPQYWANLALLARHTRDSSTAATAWRHASALWPGMPEPRDCTWEFAPAG